MKNPNKSRKTAPQVVFHFIAEAGMLMQMPRSHKRHLGNTFDTVSSHSHHVSIIAYCITRLEGLSHEEGLKAITMGALHDLAEARTSDLDFVAKHYATVDEEKATDHQFEKLPFGQELKKVVKEYADRDTLVAKCAKDADAIEQMYQEWVLAHTGNKMAEKWFIGDYTNRVPFLRTKSAKKLALIMKKSHPHQWWFEDLVEKKLNKEFLNGKK